MERHGCNHALDSYRKHLEKVLESLPHVVEWTTVSEAKHSKKEVLQLFVSPVVFFLMFFVIVICLCVIHVTRGSLMCYGGFLLVWQGEGRRGWWERTLGCIWRCRRCCRCLGRVSRKGRTGKPQIRFRNFKDFLKSLPSFVNALAL